MGECRWDTLINHRLIAYFHAHNAFFFDLLNISA